MWQVGEMCRFLMKIAAMWRSSYLPFDGRFVNRPYTAPNNVTDTVVGEGLKSPPVISWHKQQSCHCSAGILFLLA